MLAGETRGSASFHAHARNTWHLAMLAFRAHAGTPPASRSHTPCSGPARGTLRCTGSGVVRRALRSCDRFAPRSYGSCLTARAARSCSRKPLGSRLHAARSRKPFGSRSHAARSRKPFGSRLHAARSRKPFGSRSRASQPACTLRHPRLRNRDRRYLVRYRRTAARIRPRPRGPEHLRFARGPEPCGPCTRAGTHLRTLRPGAHAPAVARSFRFGRSHHCACSTSAYRHREA
jgi:hypothetical protein